MNTIPSTETLDSYINQNGVKPGVAKLDQFVKALKLRGTPKLYAQDGNGGKAIAYVKFFDPTGSWTWYATEFDGYDLCFGKVVSNEVELGYFNLSELAVIGSHFGIGIEIDVHFLPSPLDQCK